MKRKKKVSCCVNAGCFSGGRGRRDDWSSELEYEKDYEKYGREYEREYARLCELQRSLTREERSKRSEETTTFEQSTFSGRHSSFDALEITEEHLEQDPKTVPQQGGVEESEYDVQLLEKLLKEAEEEEMLDRRQKQEEKEEEKQRRKNEEMARRKREEEEIERRRREEAGRKERELQEIARRKREEEEIERRRREEAGRKERELQEIARSRREAIERKGSEEEEIARRKREELARRKSEEEMAWRKRQEEENFRRQRDELARRKWEEEEIQRRKREEDEILRGQKEEVARRKWEEEEIARRKRDQEEIARRRREQEEIESKQKEELSKRKWEEEQNARRKREEEEIVRRQKEELARRKGEEIARKKEELARKEREEDIARTRREEQARREREQEETARKKKEELARKEREEDIARTRREEQARREREQEEIARRRREELARQKMEEEEEIAHRRMEELAREKREEEEEIAKRKKEEEEQLEGWQIQQDLPWMSFTQEAKIRDRGVSMNGDRIDRIQRIDSERYYASPSVSGRSTWSSSEMGDVSRRSIPYKERGWHNEWKEEEQEEEVKLIRNRTKRGKEVASDFDNGALSSTLDLPSDEWDSGRLTNNPFSPLHLGAGFQRKFQRRREELLSRFELQLLAVAKITKSRFHGRLEKAATIVFGVLGVALLFGLFLLYLSFIARVRPPGECVNERIILNFSATRIRVRGGRYISFREQGVGADRAEHSVVVVHDLLSSRLAGIPGISESLLEEYKVRLISYDRPGYGQSDSHLGRNFNTSAYDILEIADALNLGEKFWVVGFGGGGPHVWAAIKYLPERLAGVALFAPAGNPYGSNMNKEEIEETWGVLTLRQKWMHSIARRFPALLPRLLQRTAVTNSPYVPRNVRLSLGKKDQEWMEQPHVMKVWQEDVKEALRHGCAFSVAEELMLLVNDWGFSLSELPFKESTVESIFHHVASLFGREKKPKIYDGPIHIWQGTDDQLVPVTINNIAKRLVEQNGLLDLKTKLSPVKLHYLPGEGHFSWFWFCDECHRRIFQILFRQNETEAEEEALPFSSKGFSKEDYEAIVKAFAALKMTPQPYNAEDGRGTAGKPADDSATTNTSDEEFKKVLRNVLRNKKAEEEYLRQQKAEVNHETKEGRLSRDVEEVHPMTCRATNEALRDKSVLYVCPEDEVDMANEKDFTHKGTRNTIKAPGIQSVSERENPKGTKNRTGYISTYLGGLSTLVKRLARNRK